MLRLLRNPALLRNTRPTANLHTRLLHRSPPTRPRYKTWSRGALVLCAGVPLYLGTLDASQEPEIPSHASLPELVRSYIVYTMCAIPVLVDYSPKILEVVSSIPGVKQVAEAFIRITFFDQFVGGDTANETIPLLRKLRADNVAALLVYSAEVDEASASGHSPHDKGFSDRPSAYKQVVDEVIHCVTVAGEFDDHLGLPFRSTWVAVKASALLPDAHALKKLSEYIVATRPALSSRQILFPGCPHSSDLDILDSNAPSNLSEEDIRSLKELHANLIRICERAEQKGVRVIFDAEYSWYQPALDALTLSLMKRFNAIPKDSEQSNIQPLIYATFQAYLRRTPEQLAQSIEDARAGNYTLGVKLVRGAYHHKENHVHGVRGGPSISPDPLSPVWSNKAETDTCFDDCADTIMNVIYEDVRDGKNNTPSIGVLFGTHNWKSCEKVLESIQRAGLGKKDEDDKLVIDPALQGRVMIGQLYGMSDALTDYIRMSAKSDNPFVTKYLPYGALADVMPYLSRRAIENKSVLGEGGASTEKRRAATEIYRRIFGRLIG